MNFRFHFCCVETIKMPKQRWEKEKKFMVTFRGFESDLRTFFNKIRSFFFTLSKMIRKYTFFHIRLLLTLNNLSFWCQTSSSSSGMYGCSRLKSSLERDKILRRETILKMSEKQNQINFIATWKSLILLSDVRNAIINRKNKRSWHQQNSFNCARIVFFLLNFLLLSIFHFCSSWLKAIFFRSVVLQVAQEKYWIINEKRHFAWFKQMNIYRFIYHFWLSFVHANRWQS